MEKVFLRRRRACLAAALLLAGWPLVPGARAGHPAGDRISGPAWWDVRMVVTAKGDYALEGGRTPISGEYVCRASWEGRLEPDGDDFLLIHLRSEILEWRVRETAGPAGRESVLETPPATWPTLRMNYVIKDGYEVEFVFNLGGIPVPLHESPFVVTLDLPRSSARQPGLPGRGYGDHVCRGSCRIVLPETALQEKAPERRFSWDWRQEKQHVHEDRTYVVTQGHTAEVTVALAVH
jgi:hypothetical protein